MKKSIFVGLTVIAVMSVMAIGMPSFGVESTVVMKTIKENVDTDRSDYGPGQDNEGGRGRGPGGFRGEMMRFFRNELDLTPEQQAKMRELRKESRQSSREVRTAMRGVRDEKLKMLLTGKVDKIRLADLDKQLTKYHTQLHEARLKMQRDRLAILTPDQVKRLGEFLKNKRDEFRARRSSRRGHHRNFDRN